MTQANAVGLGTVFATAVVLFTPVVGRGDEALLAEVKSAWERQQNAIRSARFAWAQKDTHPRGSWGSNPPKPANDVIDDGWGKLTLDGNKVRVHTKSLIWDSSIGDFAPHESDSAFDGERFVSLQYPSTTKWHQGRITQRKHNINSNSINLWPLMMAVRGRDPNMTGDPLSEYSAARRVTLGGRALVELTIERNESRGQTKLWVDPSRGFTVARCDSYLKTGELSDRIDATADQIDGHWLPTKCQIQVFNGKALRRQSELSFSERTVNPPTGDRDFVIAFPPGTKVIDTSSVGADGRGKENAYLVREDGTERIILPSESRIPYDELLRTQPGELTGGAPSGWWTTPRSVAVGVGVVAVVLVVASRRHSRRLPAAG